MNTGKVEENIEENVREKIKLDKSYLNYHSIIDQKLPYKFAYLDDWRLKESKLLLEEAEFISKNNLSENNETKYRVYNRGTIIKVDFGVSLGSEMSQVHFAIVLNNYDNPKNNVLTVIPLTSKKSKYNLDLGDLVIGKLTKKIKEEIIKLGEEEEKDPSNLENQIKARKIKTVLSYYKSSEKNTYACVSLITTISKTRIFQPINEYDIIGRARCSSEVMNMIDKEILGKITKIDLTKEKK